MCKQEQRFLLSCVRERVLLLFPYTVWSGRLLSLVREIEAPGTALMVPGALCFLGGFVATKLFVGNLSFNTTSADLESLFSQAGSVVSANVITDKFTGRSRGFGFVEMANNQEAQSAIERFNGAEVQGRPLTVNEAKPQERSGGGGGRSFGGGGRGGSGGGGWNKGGGGGGGGGRERRW